MVYVPTFTIFYHYKTTNVGKYTNRPMDPSWEMLTKTDRSKNREM